VTYLLLSYAISGLLVAAGLLVANTLFGPEANETRHYVWAFLLWPVVLYLAVTEVISND